jgi:hypothetical protein
MVRIMRTPINEKRYDLDSMRWKPRKRIFSVWLIHIDYDDWQMYWCPDCRSPIAQYKGSLVMEHPGFESADLKKAAIMIQCKNPQCGRKIVFQDAIHRDE